MILYVKASLAVLLMASAILASSFFFGADSSLKNKRQDDDAVMSGNDILNSEKITQQNSFAEEHLKQNTQKQKQNTDKGKVSRQERNELYLAMQNLKQESPNEAGSLQNNSGHAPELNPEWMLDALLQNPNAELFNTNDNGNALYTDNYSFLKFDLPDSYASEDKKSENPNNEKYAQEKLYVNILASILMKYQYENNTPKAVEKFNSWFTNKNPEGKEQVIKEANDYLRIAEVLQNTSGIPDSFKGINDRMARAYKVAGEKMLLLTKEMSDDEKVQVLESYTKAANDVTKAYIAVSDMIDILGISFDQNEPGRLFVFPGSKVPWNEN